MSEPIIRLRIVGEKESIRKLADELAPKLPNGPRGGRSYQVHDRDDGVTAGLYLKVPVNSLRALFAGDSQTAGATRPPDATLLDALDPRRYVYSAEPKPDQSRIIIPLR